MFMRKVIFLIPIALIASLIVLPQANAANIKAGRACTRVSSVKVVAGIKFTCTKSGRKLIWSKGVKVLPKPGTQVAFKASIPITLPIPQDGVITFANVLDHISEIPNVAWQKVQDVIASNNDVAVKHDVYIGPNTQVSISGGTGQIESTLGKATKLWSGFALTKYYSVVYYNLTDEKWAEQRTKDIWNAKGYEASTVGAALHALEISCQSQSAPGVGGADLGYCRGADAGAVTNSDNAFIQMAEGDVQHPDTRGSILVHEFTHTIQSAQWIGNANCHNEGNNCSRTELGKSFAPCWINEGQPNGINAMVVNSNFSSYLIDRSFGKDPSQKVTDYSADSLRNYLYDQSPSTCYRNGALYQLGYGVGAMTIEALVAIGGPQATMALFALGAEGQDFPTAFKNVYGISWSEASTILSKVLAAEYGASPISTVK